MYVPLAIAIIQIYCLAVINKKNRLPFIYQKEKILRFLRAFHYFTLAIVCIIILLSVYQISLRGYWTSRFFFWLYLLSGMLVFALANGSLIKKIEKLYLSLIFFLPLACWMMMAVPFFGAQINAWAYYNIAGAASDIIYYDNHYRIQHQFSGILGPSSPPVLYQKKGIFEYRLCSLNIDPTSKLSNWQICDLNENVVAIYFNSSFESDTYRYLQPDTIFINK